MMMIRKQTALTRSGLWHTPSRSKFKHQTQQLSDPFEKPLEATYPNHA
jgi:hypothetical protein